MTYYFTQKCTACGFENGTLLSPDPDPVSCLMPCVDCKGETYWMPLGESESGCTPTDVMTRMANNFARKQASREAE